MKKLDTTHQQSTASQDMSAALFEFRDALVTLSLSLKDLLFEHDQQGRQATEQATQVLFEKIRKR
jgi:hypothetical protein